MSGCCCSIDTIGGQESGGGGDGSGINVQDEGAVVQIGTLTLNFVGAGVTAAVGGPNLVDVSIPGGAVAPLFSQDFLDNTTVDQLIGTTSDGCICVDFSLSNVSGDSTCYRFTVGVSATGLGFDCLQIPSDSPLTTVVPTAVIVGLQVFLRLTGIGAGTNTGLRGRVVDTVPRGF